MNDSTLAYGNVAILSMLTTILVLLPLHGIVVIGQAVAALCGIALTTLYAVAAYRIEHPRRTAVRR